MCILYIVSVSMSVIIAIRQHLQHLCSMDCAVFMNVLQMDSVLYQQMDSGCIISICTWDKFISHRRIFFRNTNPFPYTFIYPSNLINQRYIRLGKCLL